MVDQLVVDFSASIKAVKIKNILQNLRSHKPRLIFDKPYDTGLRDLLLNTPVEELFHPERINDRNCCKSVVSGLLIWNDCEDEAHALAQNIHTAEGSYFHAIIHRREPDIWNSGYWFNRTGEHPVYALVYDYVVGYSPDDIKKIIIPENTWNPEIFNKLIDDAQKSGNTDDEVLTDIQHAELLFLLAHSYRHSIGG